MISSKFSSKLHLNPLAAVAVVAALAGGCAGGGDSQLDPGRHDPVDEIPDAPDPCAGMLDGFHCDVQGGVELSYACRDGRLVGEEPCATGCGPTGCLEDEPSVDPCAQAPTDGTYCGGNLGGVEGVLYTCAEGVTLDTTVCDHGCGGETVGAPHACDPAPETPPSDPCAHASGSGVYCGDDIMGETGTVYTCENGTTLETQTCDGSCDDGACDDVAGGTCISPPSGPVSLGYQGCGSAQHHGHDIALPYGTLLAAPVSGTVVGMALGHPNCWAESGPYFGHCSLSCWNSFNYVKLKADGGDPLVPGNDLYVYYLHISSIAAGLQVGAHVDNGAPLAAVGSSGCVSGPNVEIQVVSVPAGQPASLGTCNSVDPATRFCGAIGGCGCQAGQDNFCNYGPNTPGCPMTQAGGYCDFNGDQSYADANWSQGYYHYQKVCGS